MRKTIFSRQKINKLITVVACSVIDSISLNTFHFDGIYAVFQFQSLSIACIISYLPINAHLASSSPSTFIKKSVYYTVLPIEF